jgi:hypothetical protein
MVFDMDMIRYFADARNLEQKLVSMLFDTDTIRYFADAGNLEQKLVWMLFDTDTIRYFRRSFAQKSIQNLVRCCLTLI